MSHVAYSMPNLSPPTFSSSRTHQFRTHAPSHTRAHTLTCSHTRMIRPCTLTHAHTCQTHYYYYTLHTLCDIGTPISCSSHTHRLSHSGKKKKKEEEKPEELMHETIAAHGKKHAKKKGEKGNARVDGWDGRQHLETLCTVSALYCAFFSFVPLFVLHSPESWVKVGYQHRLFALLSWWLRFVLSSCGSSDNRRTRARRVWRCANTLAEDNSISGLR